MSSPTPVVPVSSLAAAALSRASAGDSSSDSARIEKMLQTFAKDPAHIGKDHRQMAIDALKNTAEIRKQLALNAIPSEPINSDIPAAVADDDAVMQTVPDVITEAPMGKQLKQCIIRNHNSLELQ